MGILYPEIDFENSAIEQNEVIVDFVASVDISAYSFVTSDGKEVDSGVIATRNKNIGLSINAVANGFAGKAVQVGIVKNAAWSWIVGDKLYINGNSISATPPSSGYVQSIGTATKTDTIEVNIHLSILL